MPVIVRAASAVQPNDRSLAAGLQANQTAVSSAQREGRTYSGSDRVNDRVFRAAREYRATAMPEVRRQRGPFGFGSARLHGKPAHTRDGDRRRRGGQLHVRGPEGSTPVSPSRTRTTSDHAAADIRGERLARAAQVRGNMRGR